VPRRASIARCFASITAVGMVTAAGTVRGQDDGAERRSQSEPSTEEIVAKLRTVPHDERPPLVRDLIDRGAAALDAVRAALDAAPDGAPGAAGESARRALERARTWIVAATVVETLRRGIESQLTFDGQYAELAASNEENVPALLALLDDETTAFEVRIAACRALADVHDESAVPRLRDLAADLLLSPTLRAEIGVVLASFGDTHAVDRELRELTRFAASTRPTVRLGANLQLANLAYRIRDYEKAVAAYEQVLTVSRDLYESRQRAGLPPALLEPLRSQLTLHYYNAACSNTLHGNLERAKEYLRKAVEGHPEHFSNIEKDGDLRRLRGDPSYAEFRRELGKLFEDEEL